MTLEIKVTTYDNCRDVMDKINHVLMAYGMSFQDDGLEHDGFNIFVLTLTPVTNYTFHGRGRVRGEGESA
jgi:hypothetical protein